MRMDRSCCWKGDFSALWYGKVGILVGRVCWVIGRCVLLGGGGLPRSPSAPRVLLGVSARSSAKPSHNTCGLSPTNTFRPITLVLYHLYSVISHVIPLRLLQTLNLHRWNCNVFPRSRKITGLNYVRDLSGPGLPSPAVIAARPSHNTCGLPSTNTFRPITRLRCLESLEGPPSPHQLSVNLCNRNVMLVCGGLFPPVNASFRPFFRGFVQVAAHVMRCEACQWVE